jgi:putative zinc finger/helix-turn-helix YgiT family protein
MTSDILPPLAEKDRPFPWRCFECRNKEVYPQATDYETTIKHDGRPYTFRIPDLMIPTCRKCGAQVLTSAEDERIRDALRAEAGLLTSQEIKIRRVQLGMNQQELAEQLGVAKETISRWETGAIQSRAMDNLLRLFFALPEVRNLLRGESEQDPQPVNPAESVVSPMEFVADLNPTPPHDLLDWDENSVPAQPGAYLLMAGAETSFRYPRGESPVFYIGKADVLRHRLRTHRKKIGQAKNDRGLCLYFPVYEFGASFGVRYSFIQAREERFPPFLEILLMARFAKQYRSLPIANNAGSRKLIRTLIELEADGNLPWGGHLLMEMATATKMS